MTDLKTLVATAGLALTLTLTLALTAPANAQEATTTEPQAPAAQEGEHKFDQAAEYYGECAGAEVENFAAIQDQIQAFTDIKLMAETVNDPEKFFALMAVVNDPHTIHVMASCASEPVMWDTWMEGGTDMDNWLAAMSNMMNPAGMMKWMTAPMNPAIWNQMLTHADPARYAKWSAALMNPTFYTPVTNMTKAEWYEKRLDWLSDGDSFQPLINFMMMDEFLNWGE